jgi:GNAT superfamily N-acetyltransferase
MPERPPADGDAPAVTFREIGPADEAELARFLEENDRPEIVRTFNPFPMTAETARRIAAAPRRDRYYGAFDGDRLVALSMLRGWDEGWAVPSFGIVVDHRAHGRGLGGRLTAWTVDAARTLGAPSVRLTVFASNGPGIHVYQRVGFTERSRSPATVAGVPDERIVMTLDLP